LTGAVAGANVSALDASGTTPFLDKNVFVPNGGDPATVELQFPDSGMQAATFLAVHTAQKVSAIGVTATAPGAIFTNAVRVSPSVDNNTKYCFAANPSQGCPTGLTLRVEPTLANDRAVIAHETGHWIHHMNINTNFFHSYTYSQTDAGNPGDGTVCASRRTSDGSHDFGSIEWQASAHLEGLADFFQAVTYNNPKAKACSIYQHAGSTFKLDCEQAGQTLRTGWGPIRTQLRAISTALANDFTDATVGNIFDGTPTRGTP
jgi:hypothetical protein